jgi:hypothetical protein
MKKVLKALIINDKKIHIINFRPIIEENSSSKRVLQRFKIWRGPTGKLKPREYAWK